MRKRPALGALSGTSLAALAAMSKLSFRARALDSSKPLPVYNAREVPDLSDYQAINRTVPQMPTGMEKEEETVRRELDPHPSEPVRDWTPF